MMFLLRNMTHSNQRRKITDNLIFRMYKCGLSIEETAKLCFKSVRTVTDWDNGKPIPPECRRLMKIYSGRDLEALHDDWRGWKIKQGELITPNGWTLTPDRIISGNALLEINADEDRKSKATIIRAARLIQSIRYK